VLQRIPGKFEVLVFRWRPLASLPCQAPAPPFQLVGAPHQKVFLGPLRTEVEFKLLGAWAEVLSAVVGPRVVGADLPGFPGAPGLADDRFRPHSDEVPGGLLAFRRLVRLGPLLVHSDRLDACDRARRPVPCRAQRGGGVGPV
jgi:hypothetical protein